MEDTIAAVMYVPDFVGSPSCFVCVTCGAEYRSWLAAGEIYCQSPLIRALMHELELLREQLRHAVYGCVWPRRAALTRKAGGGHVG